MPRLDVAGVSVVDPPVDLDDADAELTVAEVVRIAGGCLVVEYVALAGRTVARVRELLAGDSSVRGVAEPVRGLTEDHDDITGTAKPHPTLDAGHHDDGAGAQWHITSDIEQLWRGWDPDVPVIVAVLDSGVGITHLDLDDQVAPGGPGGCHTTPRLAHGTAMAGIIAAEHYDPPTSNRDVAGVAPGAKILSLRVVLRGDTDNPCTSTPKPLTTAAAVAEAVNLGARVINMSIGGGDPVNPADLEVGGVPIPSSDTYEIVLRAASMLGVVLVTSVGNCGSESSWAAYGCGEHNEKRRPALYPDVIAVAATTHEPAQDSGERRSSSSVNTNVDLAAPGEEIRTTSCMLSDIIPLPPTSVIPPLTCDTTGEVSGTSAAAAFVSGVAAHLVNRHPDATVGQVRAALEESALAPPRPAVDDLTARGRDGDDELFEMMNGRRVKLLAGNFHTSVGLHAPTAEYGRGIVDPATAVSQLGLIIKGLELEDDPSWFVEMSAGARHTCGLRGNGAVQCWGDSVVRDATPKFGFVSLSSPPTGRFVCGVRVNGTAQCWGELPSKLTSPVAVPSGTGALQGRFSQVAAGDRHVCGLRPAEELEDDDDGREAGAVVCWGDSSDEQTLVPPRLRSFGESSGVQTVKVVAGSAHSCALLTTGEVECWGDNGDGRAPMSLSLRASDVAAGASHTCAVTLASQVACFGRTVGGHATAPVGRFAEISAGANHMCGLLARDSADQPTGRLACWGDSGGDRLDAPSGRFSQVSAGELHSCALEVAATVRCWGDDTYDLVSSGGLLGELSLSVDGVDLLGGEFDPDVFEYTVGPSSGAAVLRAAVDAADGSQSRIVVASGNGGEVFPLSRSRPVSLDGGAVFEVRVGAIFGLGERQVYRIRVAPRLSGLGVRAATGGADCPVAGCVAFDLVPGFDPEVFDYRVVVPADVGLVTVEYSADGGFATVFPSDAVPPLSGAVDPSPGHQVALSTDRGFVSVSVGNDHACGLKSGGSAVCWGRGDFGQLLVPSGSFVSVSAGAFHSCGVRVGGSAVCWGHSGHGRLGVPLGSFSSVSAGYGHSCGVRTDATAVCWGNGYSGQSAVPSGSYVSVSAGDAHSCGVRPVECPVSQGLAVGP